MRRKTICCATSTQMPDLGLELVASFAHGLHLLQYEEQTHLYAARLPRERMRKRGGDHVHFVLGAAMACHAFCWLQRPRLPLLPSIMTKVRRVWTPENSQPALI